MRIWAQPRTCQVNEVRGCAGLLAEFGLTPTPERRHGTGARRRHFLIGDIGSGGKHQHVLGSTNTSWPGSPGRFRAGSLRPGRFSSRGLFAEYPGFYAAINTPGGNGGRCRRLGHGTAPRGPSAHRRQGRREYPGRRSDGVPGPRPAAARATAVTRAYRDERRDRGLAGRRAGPCADRAGRGDRTSGTPGFVARLPSLHCKLAKRRRAAGNRLLAGNRFDEWAGME